MTVAIEVSGADEVRSYRDLKHKGRRKKRRVGKLAHCFAPLRCGIVRIDRVDVAAPHGDHASVAACVTGDQIRYAIAVKVCRCQGQWLVQVRLLFETEATTQKPIEEARLQRDRRRLGG